MEDYQIVRVHSTIEERNTIYEWKIHQFFSITRFSELYNTERSTIQSPDFSTNNDPGDSSWYLKICIKNDWASNGFLSITLGYCGHGHQNLKTKYSICIIDNEKNKRFLQKGSKIFKYDEEIILKNFNVSELMDERSKLMPDNTFTVSLKITDFIVRSDTSLPITKLRLKKLKQIVDDSTALFHSKEGSDIILVVGDKKIPAHKTLLMTRSPVFSAMFIYKPIENRENKVDIPDMDPDTCEKLLEFIYTDNVTNLDEVAERLFEAADKYQIPVLKQLCEKSLCKNITVQNAVQYLVLLDRHNSDKKFLNYIVDFIVINSKIIAETEEYKALLSTNPALLLTVLTKICNIK